MQTHTSKGNRVPTFPAPQRHASPRSVAEDELARGLGHPVALSLARLHRRSCAPLALERTALQRLIARLRVGGRSTPDRRISTSRCGEVAVAVAVERVALRCGVAVVSDGSLDHRSLLIHLSSHELRAIKEGGNWHEQAARLWAVKEAVYKAAPQNSQHWSADVEILPAKSEVSLARLGESVFRYACTRLGTAWLSVATLPNWKVGDLHVQ